MTRSFAPILLALFGIACQSSEPASNSTHVVAQSASTLTLHLEVGGIT